MPSALDSIKRAMRLLGVYSIGEQPSADEADIGLSALNSMLDSFATDRLVVYAPTLDTITWTPSAPSVTVGPTGGFVTTRPIEVLSSSYFDYQGVSYPLTPLTVDEYNSINLKTTTSDIPQYIWTNPTFPNATVYLFPVPTVAVSLKLWSIKQLISIPSLTTDLALPPGYKDFIDFNLAEALAPEFEVPVPAAVAKKAALTRKTIARINYIPRRLTFPAIGLPKSSRFNIYTGNAE